MNNLREVHCPFCDSTNFEPFSLYGQTLLGSQYYCQNCKSIFEAIRYDEEAKPTKNKPKIKGSRD